MLYASVTQSISQVSIYCLNYRAANLQDDLPHFDFAARLGFDVDLSGPSCGPEHDTDIRREQFISASAVVHDRGPEI